MVELEDFKYGGTNITSFRLVDPAQEEVRAVVADWVRDDIRSFGGRGKKHFTGGGGSKLGLRVREMMMTSIQRRNPCERRGELTTRSLYLPSVYHTMP